MLFPEEDAGELKKWIIKRLENTSDADADVLADYVLALLRHDGDINTVRQLCMAEIPDFLKEDTSIFVRDVFDALQYKTYLSGGPPRRNSQQFAPPTGPSAPAFNNPNMGPSMGHQNGSRKRAFDGRGDGDSQMYMGGADQNSRAFKQPRRGGAAGRGAFDNFNNGRGGFQGRPQHMQMPNAQFMSNMPNMPGSPTGLPLDPNNPMAAILAMQQAMGAMGMPLPQGMPGFPPNGANQNRGHPGPTGQRKQRCRDYDQKGFCARGNTCMFEHGQDSIYVPGGASKPTDEYDPSNASLMTGSQNQNDNNQRPPPYNGFENNRGGMGRGRGQSMGRGGSQMHSNRGARRSEFSSDRANFNKNNTTIVVEQIPEDKFSEETVREFFSQFGTIKEVEMKPYKRLALITFDDWNGANSAYSSPKVIFDNRFVKVYWFTNNEALPNPPANGPFNGANNNGASGPVPARETDEPQIDIEEFAKKQQEVQKAHEEKMKKKQEMEATRKELERRQEELLKNQAEEKRKLMERLAAKSGKSVSPGLNTEGGSPAPAPSSQTEALKKQLAALEAEAQSLGLPSLDSPLSDDTWGGRGRGRGGYRGRGTFAPRGFRGGFRGRGGAAFGGGAPARYNLDNRTKKIAVSGADFTNPQIDESLREHLLGIGEYTELTNTPSGCQITFKDRHIAEKFMYGLQNGEIPSVGRVELSWIQTPLPPVTLPNTQSPTGGGNAESDSKMEGAMEGDAMAQDSNSMGMSGHGGEREMQENIDYDVAGDDDWQ
ncbi:hypothetical protein ACHAO1_005802 [Botrytis cinerea]